MGNDTYKIIGRHPFNGRQIRKCIYTSKSDYDNYKNELTARYKTYLNVEHYELINGKWVPLRAVAYIGGCTWINGYKY